MVSLKVLHLFYQIVIMQIVGSLLYATFIAPNGIIGSPVWKALATRCHQYILDNSQIVRNRRVLDVGCGCGAGSIAASMMKAARVVANDIDPYAVLATQINSEMNKTTLETATNNYIGTQCDEFDTILIGDMFYDEEFSEMLFKWLGALAARNKLVLIGDPGRHGLTTTRRSQLARLATYELPVTSRAENHGYTHTTLWTILPSPITTPEPSPIASPGLVNAGKLVE